MPASQSPLSHLLVRDYSQRSSTGALHTLKKPPFCLSRFFTGTFSPGVQILSNSPESVQEKMLPSLQSGNHVTRRGKAGCSSRSACEMHSSDIQSTLTDKARESWQQQLDLALAPLCSLASAQRLMARVQWSRRLQRVLGVCLYHHGQASWKEERAGRRLCNRKWASYSVPASKFHALFCFILFPFKSFTAVNTVCTVLKKCTGSRCPFHLWKNRVIIKHHKKRKWEIKQTI